MDSIQRTLEPQLIKRLKPNKVLLLMGARRVGKTLLIKQVVKSFDQNKVLVLNGEDYNDANLLQERSVSNYNNLLDGIDLLVIDEAQYIPDIGSKLKLIVDEIVGIKVLVTGSSMFDLTNQMGEPLVGRKTTLYLYPLAQIEFAKYENKKQTKDNLPLRLIYGGYPELIHLDTLNDKSDYLLELVNDYLLKDILTYETIKKSNKIYDLLRLIAYQVGSEVSLQELGNQLQLSKNTIERYLDLLTKVFVIFKVEGYSKNLRKEITKSSKWYFYDNGVRNAILRDFSLLANRNDIGQLWENYLISERMKKQNYQQILSSNYFWRTYDQQEIDWIEDRDKALYAYEMKWQKGKQKIPPAFAKAYPDAEFEFIDQNGYLEFIS